MTKDIRWKQRFENLNRAFMLFEAGVNAKVKSKLEKEGVIQRFEYTFELCWKTIRDYLRFGGIETDLPRDVIKQAFAHGIIKDGQKWIEMLEDRNVMSHTYDESTFETVYGKISQEYFLAIKQVFEFLQSKAGG